MSPAATRSSRLFSDGYALRTILFWIMFFASLLSLYLISFWLPTVLHLEGLSPADAVFASSLYGAGGGLSVLLLGPLTNGFGLERVLAISLACGIVVDRRGRAGASAVSAVAGGDFRDGRMRCRRPVGRQRFVRREISSAHANHRRRLGARRRPAGRHRRTRRSAAFCWRKAGRRRISCSAPALPPQSPLYASS